jgi:hypothetical protein
MGPGYQNPYRFTPLHGAGKPLWEFKEFDFRLYCVRTVTGDFVWVGRRSGWEKQKRGKSREEAAEIERAQRLYGELKADTQVEIPS